MDTLYTAQFIMYAVFMFAIIAYTTLAASKTEDVTGKIWDKAALEGKFGAIKV